MKQIPAPGQLWQISSSEIVEIERRVQESDFLSAYYISFSSTRKGWKYKDTYFKWDEDSAFTDNKEYNFIGWAPGSKISVIEEFKCRLQLVCEEL